MSADVTDRWRRLVPYQIAGYQKMKDVNGVLADLNTRYRLELPDQRPAVDSVLSEFIRRGDDPEAKAALLMAEDNLITSAIPSIEVYCRRLEKSDDPLARYYLASARRVLEALRCAG